MSPLRLVIFDGDDTLWRTEQLYDDARARAAVVVASSGIDPALWSDLQKKYDLQNVRTMGLGRDRFPTSSIQAYKELSRDSFDEKIGIAVWEAASSVFTSPAPVVPAVLETLSTLAESHTLVLLTKGDREVQHARVHNHSLADLFDAIVIVSAKRSSTFAGLCQVYGCPPGESWSVGNSLASDIIPAHEAGMRTIWLDAYVWEHERREMAAPEETIEIDDLRKVVETILSCS